MKGDRQRANGFHGNAAMRIDPYLTNTCLADLTGGSAVFDETSVKARALIGVRRRSALGRVELRRPEQTVTIAALALSREGPPS